MPQHILALELCNKEHSQWTLDLISKQFPFFFSSLPPFLFLLLLLKKKKKFCQKSNLIMLTAWDVLQFLQDTYKCDQILIPLFSALTFFFPPLPSKHTPHAAPRLAVSIPGAQITPGTLSPTPFKISGERWKHFERKGKFSKSKQRLWLGLSVCLVRVCTCAFRHAGGRNSASHRGAGMKDGKRNLPEALLSQEMKGVSSCSAQEQEC